MPTYQNRTGVITTFGEYQFAPFETREIKRNIFYTEPVVCTSIDPQYNPYTVRLKNAVVNRACKPFIHNHTLVIRIDDEFSPEDKLYDADYKPTVKNSDGSKAEIGVWATVMEPRVRTMYQLMRVIEFTKRAGSWTVSVVGMEKVPTCLLDLEYEIIYLSVLSLNGTAIDVSTKPY